MTTSRRGKQKHSADDIAKLADKGEDVSRFFGNNGKMGSLKNGAKDGNRTHDPRFTKAVHYRCATLALRK